MRRLLAGLDEREDAKASRDRALLRLAFELGLRRGEFAGLDLEQLDLEAGTLAVLGKGLMRTVFSTCPTAGGRQRRGGAPRRTPSLRKQQSNPGRGQPALEAIQVPLTLANQQQKELGRVGRPNHVRRFMNGNTLP